MAPLTTTQRIVAVKVFEENRQFINHHRGLNQQDKWRRKRDSNPRASHPANGFQDRRFQPLTHSSVFYLT